MASTAAKRYAQAVFELAKERGALDAWETDLTRLSELVGNPEARNFFASPSVPSDRKMALLDEALGGGSDETRNLVKLLVERNRIEDIPQISALYQAAVRAERGIVFADVTTAEPLNEQETALVREQLKNLIGRDVELRPRVDPSIIGGIIAQVGDQLIDGSVVSQLRRLRTRLATAAR
ncbi:MAG TPA: F0F1 ATP synthase subunit delta [Thermomicrobiales bacterium]|nr:F0F1 ATP synthase subunit delta [Thermomicrobiales bacterium]